MRDIVKAMLMLYCLCWLPASHAQEAPTVPAQAENSAAAEEVEGRQEHKEGGHTRFWLVFLFSILFVVSSAAGLNALGGKPPRGQGKPPPPRKKPGDESRRFRL